MANFRLVFANFEVKRKVYFCAHLCFSPKSQLYTHLKTCNLRPRTEIRY